MSFEDLIKISQILSIINTIVFILITKPMKILLIMSLLLSIICCITCDMSESQRKDCGYLGINQQLCEAKGCCWKPIGFINQVSNDIPWCYNPGASTVYNNITFSWKGGQGFDSDFYNKMYALFDANIDIQGLGGVVAAPDYETVIGSYYYHWMRDAALTMRTYLEINNFDLTKVQKKMKSYVNWVKKVQSVIDPQGFDIRINPKFQLPNGQAFVGGWCRPQTDGPGLRSAALLLFSDLLVKNGQQSYVTSNVLPLIKFDLDWLLVNWQSQGCDLWQQFRSDDLFWNRAGFVYTFGLCAQYFAKVGDTSYAQKCSSTKDSVQATLNGHWTGTEIREGINREKNSAVIHAFSSFNVYPITDERISKTIQVQIQTFCNEYLINQEDIKNGIPGILIGRYPGDVYAGGNPWQLLTAVLAKSFYQGANLLLDSNGFLKEADKTAWLDLLSLNSESSHQEIIQATFEAGDAIMYRLYQKVKGDNGHISQQIDRNNGAQKNAKDLTWSYANILSAMVERQQVALKMGKVIEVQKY